MPESYCWLALTLEARIPVIVLGFNLRPCQTTDLMSMQDRKRNMGQSEAIRQPWWSLFDQGHLRSCGLDSLPLSALPGWAVDAHVLSIIHLMMSLMGENETVQSLGVINWHALKKWIL